MSNTRTKALARVPAPAALRPAARAPAAPSQADLHKRIATLEEQVTSLLKDRSRRRIGGAGSSQQPNITALSVPAGPRNDAKFVGSTTAPDGFVFRPGAVFPNNGPVQQNVYTTGNSVGSDGLAVLQGVLAGSGLFPAVALPASTVYLDYSLASDTYTQTTNLILGTGECSLVGLASPTTAALPTHKTGGFALSGLVSVRDVILQVTGETAATETVGQIDLWGQAQISTDGNYFYDTGSHALTLNLRGSSILGDATNAVIGNSTGVITVNVYDGALITANSLPTAHCNIVVWSPGAVVDSSYAAQTTYSYAPVTTVTWNPYGTPSPGVYVDPTALGIYFASFPPESPISWTVECDFLEGSNDFDLTSDIDFGQSFTLVGQIYNNEYVVQAIPELDAGAFQFTSPPLEIRDLTLTCSTVGDATFGYIPAFFRISGQSKISSPTGVPLYTIVSGSGSVIHLEDQAILGDTTFGYPVIVSAVGGVGNSYLYVSAGAQVLTGALGNTGLSDWTIFMEPGAQVDATILASASVVNLSPIAFQSVVLDPDSATPGGNTFIDFGQLMQVVGMLDYYGSTSGNPLPVTVLVRSDAEISSLAFTAPNKIRFVGVDSSSGHPTLIFNDDVSFNTASGLLNISFENLNLTVQNASVTVFTDPTLTLRNCTLTVSNSGDFCDLSEGAGSSFSAYETSFNSSSDGPCVFAFGEVQVSLFEGCSIATGNEFQGDLDLAFDASTTFTTAALAALVVNTMVPLDEAGGLSCGAVNVTGADSPYQITYPTTLVYVDVTDDGEVDLLLPNPTNLPNGYVVDMIIDVGPSGTVDDTNPMTFAPNGTLGEEQMDPGTGVYSAGPWSSATPADGGTGPGTTQGLGVRARWDFEQNAWVTSMI